MDGRRFDALTKGLAQGRTRRGVLKGILGLGGAALAASVAPAGDSEAARRPPATRTPIPRCPGTQTWNSATSTCDCPAGQAQCAPNGGPACCNDTNYPSPDYRHSECCDNACCHGTCYGEEQCCPTNVVGSGSVPGTPTHRICDTVDGPLCCPFSETCCLVDGCCDTVCYGGMVGADRCCSAENYCPSDGTNPDLCCTGNATCCDSGAGDNSCVDLTVAGNCCTQADCNDRCLKCDPATHTCQPRCDPDTETCCTGQAGPGRCVTGECCRAYPSCPTGEICCQGSTGTVCFAGTECPRVCDDNDDCAGCETCDLDASTCKSLCADDEICCTEGSTDACCAAELCVEGAGCCPLLPEVSCLTPQGACCATLCVETPDGPVCCPEDSLCVSIDPRIGVCCTGETAIKLGCGTVHNTCGYTPTVGCKVDTDCGACQTCDPDTGDCSSICTSDAPQCCWGPYGDFCVPLGKTCCLGPNNCQADCEYCSDTLRYCVSRCTSDLPVCCVDADGDYCVPDGQTCCAGDTDCTGSCDTQDPPIWHQRTCGAGRYCVETVITCNGGNACTIDSCDGNAGCSYQPIECNTPPLTGCYQSSGTCDVADGLCHYEPLGAGVACSTCHLCDDAGNCSILDPDCACVPLDTGCNQGDTCCNGGYCCSSGGTSICIDSEYCCRDDQCTGGDDAQHCMVGFCHKIADAFAGLCNSHSSCDESGTQCCAGASPGDSGHCVDDLDQC